MGQRKPPGLTKRGSVWHIDKLIKGRPLRESTGESDLSKAIEVMQRRIVELRELESGRPNRTFEQAAAKYIEENGHIASISDVIMHLDELMPFIGGLYLHQVHDDSLKPFIAYRLSPGTGKRPVSKTTINLALEVVARILNLCARSWRHPSGMTWLPSAPLITRIPEDDKKKSYVLDWEEQDSLFAELHKDLAQACLYKVNTGCREQEVCGLEWSWEWQTTIPELQGRVFWIPGQNRKKVKSSMRERVVVLNDIAKSVVDSRRGIHPRYVFTTTRKVRGQLIVDRFARLNNNGWRRAWVRSGLPENDDYRKGVHNLRHTYSTRLRMLGVSKETRKSLMGHVDKDQTTEYSQAGLMELLSANQLLCSSRKTPTLSIVKMRPALQTA